ncbi:glycosyl hydrolase [Pestalotiopsis sp. NC0098]|nr:glycosyl hydrolase [Pestalotiopsis sp. NC0098]
MALLLILCQILLVGALQNPIISGWNPDPSILQVNGTYYLATSSFEYFPGTPIYASVDLANWNLISHAQTRRSQVQLYGTPTGAGVWAPTLSYHNGLFYLASMSRWTYDPVARVWPRVMFMSSPDLITWSNPIWNEPWGIDPSLFHDPKTGKSYLNLMAPNNNKDRIWGIYQCEVDLESGDCSGSYRSLWNGTLAQNSSSRLEGPKMFFKDPYYYLLAAEGGTDDQHRSSIARSNSPEGPWESAPNNPILFNGRWGFDNLTVQSTGHGTFTETPDGEWFCSFLARRKVNGSSPLGRETFLTSVTWLDGWPVLNNNEPITLSQDISGLSVQNPPLQPFEDEFCGTNLDLSWYQLRVPYTQNYALVSQSHRSSKRNGHSGQCGLTLKPNVFGLSDRDTPSALLRKQKSLNMTFSATLLPSDAPLSPRQAVGISIYLSEYSHQDIGVKGCANSTGLCIYSQLMMNTTTTVKEVPLDEHKIPRDLTFHIRANPLSYSLGYTMGNNTAIWVDEVPSSWLAWAPSGFYVFSGASWAIFATGGGEPWAPTGATVGFTKVREEYFEENIPDYDVW